MAGDHEHENGHGIRRVDGPDGHPCHESTEFPGFRGAELNLSRLKLTGGFARHRKSERG